MLKIIVIATTKSAIKYSSANKTDNDNDDGNDDDSDDADDDGDAYIQK